MTGMVDMLMVLFAVGFVVSAIALAVLELYFPEHWRPSGWVKSRLYALRIWWLERPDKIAAWLAYRVPRRVALFVFVRVTAAASVSHPTKHPDELTFGETYKSWVSGVGR